MADLATLEAHEGIATLTMRRGDKRNALSLDLIDALNESLDSIEQDESLRVVVLAGEGACFCAGMDLKGVLSDAAAMGRMLHGLSVFLRRLRRLSLPTIARVQGAAVGGGCGLMVVPDFAFTHPEAKVGYPEVDLGVCPAVVAPWLIRSLGSGRARAMLLAGGTMDGAAGHAAGLATHLVDRDDLESAVKSFAQELSKGGGHAMAVTKRWLNELDGSLDDASLDRGAELSAAVIAGDEAQSRLRPLWG